MQKFNYHTHTYRCGHADLNLMDEDYVKLFIKHGFNHIAFTDHAPEKNLIDKRTNMRMSYSKKDEYLSSINKLKEKYCDDIIIETGFEIEYLPGEEENIFELKKDVDKLILGQHFIYDEDNNLKIFHYHTFLKEDYLKYANYVKVAMEKGIPDIVAHPDIYMLGALEFGEEQRKAAHIICSTAEKLGIPLEINLTYPAMYLSNRTTKMKYPCKEFWEVASTYPNLKVLYGIDAHYQFQIDLYEEAIKFTNELLGIDTINKLNFCDEYLNIK